MGAEPNMQAQVRVVSRHVNAQPPVRSWLPTVNQFWLAGLEFKTIGFSFRDAKALYHWERDPTLVAAPACSWYIAAGYDPITLVEKLRVIQ
jgi:hypothetical protein